MNGATRFERGTAAVLAALVIGVGSPSAIALAQTSTWNTSVSGNWSDATKWANSMVADGAGNTAFFVQTGALTTSVSLDSARSIGALNFNTGLLSSTNAAWAILDVGNSLTLSSTATPTITAGRRPAVIQPVLQGTQGISLLSGTMIVFQGANTYSGITTVNGVSGTVTTLRIENNSALGASGAANKTVVTNNSRVMLAGGITTDESFDIQGNGSNGAIHGGSGTNTITGLVTLTGSAQIGGSGSGTLVFERTGGGASIDTGGNGLYFGSSIPFLGWEVRSPIVGAGSLRSPSSGTLTLTAANTYSGTTTISSGVLNIRHESALGSTAAGTTVTGGQLQLQGGITIGNEPLSITGVHTGNTGALRNVSGNNTYGGNINLPASAATRINSDTDTLSLLGEITGGADLLIGGSGNTVVSGPIKIANFGGGNYQVTKDGTGTVRFTATNTYTLPTNVNAGTLLVNGNQNQATGTMTVANTATLGGSGTVGGAVTVLDGGTLAPGDGLGVLTVRSLSLAASATTLVGIAGTARGSQYDGINLTTTGGLAYGGELRLDFQLLSAVPANTMFDIFSFSGTPTGDFGSIISTGFYAGTWSQSGGIWSLVSGDQSLSFSPVTGDITVQNAAPVPEIDPAGWGSVIALLVGGLALHERRRGATMAISA